MTPEFFVIAGPNGAGKTTYGPGLVSDGVPIFNGDLVFAELIKQYPNVEPVRLQAGVPMALEKARDAAIASRSSFAFETNFSSDLTIDLISHFKAHGYNINLIYLGLNDIITAEARVTTRVRLGGHDIPHDVIKYNFEEGINRVRNSLGMFDRMEFIDTTREAELVAMAIAKPYHYQVLRNDIEWFNTSFHTAMERLKSNKTLSETQKKQTEKKPNRPRKRRGI